MKGTLLFFVSFCFLATFSEVRGHNPARELVKEARKTLEGTFGDIKGIGKGVERTVKGFGKDVRDVVVRGKPPSRVIPSILSYFTTNYDTQISERSIAQKPGREIPNQSPTLYTNSQDQSTPQRISEVSEAPQIPPVRESNAEDLEDMAVSKGKEPRRVIPNLNPTLHTQDRPFPPIKISEKSQVPHSKPHITTKAVDVVEPSFQGNDDLIDYPDSSSDSEEYQSPVPAPGAWISANRGPTPMRIGNADVNAAFKRFLREMSGALVKMVNAVVDLRKALGD